MSDRLLVPSVDNAPYWSTVIISDKEYKIDLKVIEPYKRVLSHGGQPVTVVWWSVHRVSKLQNYFCQNFDKFPPTLIIFGTKMANRLKLYELHSFSTTHYRFCTVFWDTRCSLECVLKLSVLKSCNIILLCYQQNVLNYFIVFYSDMILLHLWCV